LQNQISEDIQRLMRYVDKDSVQNYDLRKAAFNVASIICAAFLPDRKAVGVHIKIGHGFTLESCSVLIGGVDRPAMGLEWGGGRIFYWVCPEGELPEDRMISLETIMYVARCMKKGCLRDVVGELGKQRGQEAAEKLCRELGIMPNVS
jgi:hypothetical protein